MLKVLLLLLLLFIFCWEILGARKKNQSEYSTLPLFYQLIFDLAPGLTEPQ